MHDKQTSETYQNYANYLSWTGSFRKNQMYIHEKGADSKLKEFAKCLTPNSSGLASLSSDYKSKYEPSFYFGNIAGGTARTQIGYIKGFVEWLPT